MNTLSSKREWIYYIYYLIQSESETIKSLSKLFGNWYLPQYSSTEEKKNERSLLILVYGNDFWSLIILNTGSGLGKWFIIDAS